MKCRICGSDDVDHVGLMSPYADFSIDVYDCAACKCRFTPHDDQVHDQLHATGSGGYTRHATAASEAAAFFDSNNLTGLRSYLSTRKTYRFVIEEIEKRPKIRRVAEFGCAQGALSSYFIKAGYDVTGVDVSSQSIEAARQRFGSHFVTTDEMEHSPIEPFDAVFHTGTIGCVSTPVEFTRQLLSLVKPGGVLLFNGPNVAACRTTRDLWIRGATPPDLVTLFDADFWPSQFDDNAEVTVRCDRQDTSERLHSLKRPHYSTRRLRPSPGHDSHEPKSQTATATRRFPAVRRAIGASLRASLRVSATPLLLSPRPAMYGMFVTMVRRHSKDRADHFFR